VVAFDGSLTRAPLHTQLFLDSCRPVFPRDEWDKKPTGREKAYLRLVFASFKKIIKQVRKDVKACGRTFAPRVRITKRTRVKTQKADGVATPGVVLVAKQERRSGLMSYAPERKKSALVTPIKMMSTAEMMKAAGVTALPTWDDRPD
jgi:hypothetical protein